MAKHKVKQGEHVTRIICAKGFADSAAVWGLSENKSLRNLRKNFNILMPDDELFVPEREDRVEHKPVDSKYKYVRQTTPLKLRLVVQDAQGVAAAGAPCVISVEGATKKVTAEGDGLAKLDLRPPDENARLKVVTTDGKVELNVPVLIGHLDPVTEVSGQQARLNNLGYRAGDVGKPDTGEFRSAVEEFQCDNGLNVDGKCGPKTQDKLVKVHGC